MNPALVITVLGPVLGGAGWFSELSWLFWIGVAICAITMVLNIASGVMKLPVLPVLFMGVAAFLQSPWYVGAGFGLLIWTAIEAVGEIIGLKKEGKL
jgi:apolipoprotein N-acyltransferase